MSVEEWAQHCPACGQKDGCEHNLLGECLMKIEILNSRIAELEPEIERLREVEKDSAELHNFMKKLWHRNSKLKYIIEEMFKICPCMCNTALDYECAKCEAKRILKEIKDEI